MAKAEELVSVAKAEIKGVALAATVRMIFLKFTDGMRSFIIVKRPCLILQSAGKLDQCQPG
jgi:hypothetical protein